ncbi:MAG TPA: hypothetical protein VHL30_00780 [Chlamydiales bacterium]|jgi:hypothetical protein|nr:hypothetical protein [Chlamydiales bacterium]
MWWLAIVPFLLQAFAIFLDEGVFHIRRGLPKWERIGHPLDTLTVLLCMGFVIWIPFSKTALIIYISFCIFSSLFVTKDEFVHKEHCPASEQWLHAVLFTLHPIALAMAGFIWPVVQGVSLEGWMFSWLDNPEALRRFLYGQFVAMSGFLIYQILFWNVLWKPKADGEG